MIPKAELHVHIEGTVKPDLLRILAARNGVHIPDGILDNNNEYCWQGFEAFILAYDQASSVIKTAKDYRDVVYSYLKASAESGVIYTELTASPDTAALSGVSYDDHLAGVVQGIRDAEKDFGIVSRILMIGVRHRGVASVNAVAQKVANNPHPLIVGFGLAGDEVNFPPRPFKQAFEIAHDAGLQCTIHAGEVVGPEGMWEVLDHLPMITRIGHGIRAVEDPNLVKELIDRDITLEVCPTGNIRMGIYKDYAAHPFKQLYDAGVKVTLNSDDPALFHTTIGNEYDVAGTQFGLSSDQLEVITQTAIDNSFLEEDMRLNLVKSRAP